MQYTSSIPFREDPGPWTTFPSNIVPRTAYSYQQRHFVLHTVVPRTLYSLLSLISPLREIMLRYSIASRAATRYLSKRATVFRAVDLAALVDLAAVAVAAAAAAAAAAVETVLVSSEDLRFLDTLDCVDLPCTFDVCCNLASEVGLFRDDLVFTSLVCALVLAFFDAMVGFFTMPKILGWSRVRRKSFAR